MGPPAVPNVGSPSLGRSRGGTPTLATFATTLVNVCSFAASQRPSQRLPPPTPKASFSGFKNAFEDSPDPLPSSTRARRSDTLPLAGPASRSKRALRTPDQLFKSGRRGDSKGKAKMLVEETVEEEGEDGDDSMLVDDSRADWSRSEQADESRVEEETFVPVEERDMRGEVRLALRQSLWYSIDGSISSDPLRHLHAHHLHPFRHRVRHSTATSHSTPIVLDIRTLLGQHPSHRDHRWSHFDRTRLSHVPRWRPSAHSSPNSPGTDFPLPHKPSLPLRYHRNYQNRVRGRLSRALQRVGQTTRPFRERLPSRRQSRSNGRHVLRKHGSRPRSRRSHWPPHLTLFSRRLPHSPLPAVHSLLPQ